MKTLRIISIVLLAGLMFGSSPAYAQYDPSVDVCVNGVSHSTERPGDPFTLCWRRNAPTEGVIGYKIFKSRTSGVYDTTATPHAELLDSACTNDNECEKAPLSLTDLGDHWFVVVAYDEVSDSGFSNEVRVTIKARPSSPGGCSILR